jgi:hypothetical protein
MLKAKQHATSSAPYLFIGEAGSSHWCQDVDNRLVFRMIVDESVVREFVRNAKVRSESSPRSHYAFFARNPEPKPRVLLTSILGFCRSWCGRELACRVL